MDSSDEKKTFWARLTDAYAQKFPDRKPLTQEAAGKLVTRNSPQSTGKKWKNGGQPTMENALSIALQLGVCVDWLLTGRQPRYPLSKIEASMLEWLRRLSDDLQRIEALGVLKATVILTDSRLDPISPTRRPRSPPPGLTGS